MTPLRIAIGGISHETNTYANDCFGLTEVEDFDIARDGEIIEHYRDTRTFIGGMLSEAARLDAHVVPTVAAIAQPSGTISAGAYSALKTELLSRIEAALPLDAVLLDLHGAGVVDGVDDLEGDLAKSLRALVGPAVKLVAPLDLHGNITDAMAEYLDLMLGVHFYPHVDMYERGVEAVALLPGLLDGTVTPVTHVEHIPMLLPASKTDSGPAHAVNELCWEIEQRDGVIDCTFFHGFPFTDTRHVGAHIVVATDGDRALARECARTVAQLVWDQRDDFRPETDSPESAVRRALRADKGPVVINDTSDNSGGGAPGDGTHLLRALLDADAQDTCYGFLYDPEVAAAAHAAGTGATINVRLGGKHDALHGEPIHATAYVKTITDGRFVYTTPMFAGVRANLGPMARLQIGGLDVIVGSARSQTFDAELFLLHGIDVTRYKIVALKSSNHFRAGFADLAAEIITADSPGLTTQRVEVFERQHAPRPMWPRDPNAAYAS